VAWEIPGFQFTLPAGADLSASQFCFVNADTTAAGSRAVLPAAGGRVVGVLQNKPNAAGLACSLIVDGVSKVKVGTGGATAGGTLKALADGTVTTAGAGTYAVGIALETGVAGQLIPVLLTPSGGGGLIA
jgi:hypothetical protein